MFPDTIIRDVRRALQKSIGHQLITKLQYFARSTSSPSDLWHTRKQITLYLAAFMFQTYIFSIGRRVPSNILISRSGGQLYTADLIPGESTSLCCFHAMRIGADAIMSGHGTNKADFSNNDPVPFRLTPNIQTFLTPVGIEGVLVSALMSIARCLTESEVSCLLLFRYKRSAFTLISPAYSMTSSIVSVFLFRKRCNSGMPLANQSQRRASCAISPCKISTLSSGEPSSCHVKWNEKR